MGRIPYVGKRFNAQEFRNYVMSQTRRPWWPTAGVTLHHTGLPTLYTGNAARPNGLTPDSLRALRRFYEEDKGWSSAPHIFVDDLAPRSIIVFQSLNRMGTHALSFNRTRWGIEVLGDFNREDPFAGRGRKAWEAGIAAAAILCEAGLGKVPSIGRGRTINYHRHDPLTTKTCPGTRIKDGYLTELLANYAQNHTVLNVAPSKKWRVFERGGQEMPEAFIEFDTQQNRVYVQGEGYANWMMDWPGMLKVRDFRVDATGKRWIPIRHLGVLTADSTDRKVVLRAHRGKA